MLKGCTDYRDFIRRELEERSQLNPRFSLRAFARILDLSPSFLSEVLSEKRGLSVDVAANIGKKLGLSNHELAYFCDLVMEKHARTDAARSIAQYKVSRQVHPKYYEIQLESFQVISEWYHYAILELTALKDFKSSPKWIAKKLGIKELEAKHAVERLMRLGLLKETRGKLTKTNKSIETPTDTPSEGLKRFHKSILVKASEALLTQDVNERDITAITMAIDKNKLKDAKAKIKKFRKHLCEFLESDEATDVYTLSVQLFKLSKKGA